MGEYEVRNFQSRSPIGWKLGLSIKWMLSILCTVLFGLGLVSCTTSIQGTSSSKKEVKKVLEENPEILFNIIENNPKKFFDAVGKAESSARKSMQQEARQKELAEEEKAFKNPKKPEIDSKRAIFGDTSAPVTIVEYSDFQCPYCAKAAKTVNKVLKEYKGKVRLLYKHLAFKPMAEPTARYYEAIAMESPKKAKDFHDYVYENQKKLYSEGESFLEKAAKFVKADMAGIKKHKDSQTVSDRLAADKAEAEKFEFSGTPGFLVGGIPVRGAYPFDKFKSIINKHLKEKGIAIPEGLEDSK